MKVHTAVFVAIVLVLIAFAPAQASIIASSTFDSNAQGWVGRDLNLGVSPPYPVVSTYSLTWSATGGNPGGHVSIVDPSGFWIYFSAPAAYLGNQSAAYGGSLSFDIAATTSGLPNFNDPDVILVGPGGLTLVYDVPFTPPPSTTVNWSSFTVNLNETNWRVGTLTGPLATQAQMQTVLGSLSALYIRAEYFVGLAETGYLDNVILRAGFIPEPASWILLLLGSGVCLAARRIYRSATPPTR